MCNDKAKRGFQVHSLATFDPLLATLTGAGVFDNLNTPSNDEWLRTYDNLHFLGGSVLAKAQGLQGREERRVEHAAAVRERALKPNPALLPPDPTAMMVNPAVELRDRRRRALMLARTNLAQPGPGANIPLG